MPLVSVSNISVQMEIVTSEYNDKFMLYCQQYNALRDIVWNNVRSRQTQIEFTLSVVVSGTFNLNICLFHSWQQLKMMDITSKLRFRIKTPNQTIEAVVDSYRTDEDDIGALYYVIAVVMIYGLSIVMMIASHIRRNKQDSQLRSYLKEMSILRKNDRRERIFNRVANVPTSAKPLFYKTRNDAKNNSDAIATLHENDDGLHDMRMSSNCSDENTDSVFQMSCDETQEFVTYNYAENQTRRSSKHSNAQIEVIDENVPL